MTISIKNKQIQKTFYSILVLGFFFFLSGILFFNSMSAYHTQIYIFLILPTLILVITKHNELNNLWQSNSIHLLLLLFSFILLSLLWNDTTVNDAKQIKKLLLIFTFILSLVYLHSYNNKIIIHILLLTSSIYAIAGLYSIFDLYILQDAPWNTRLIGFGNLSNPLLSSHIYGVFTIFIAAYYLNSEQKTVKSILLAFIFFSLLLFVLLTHSRTPLLGFAGTFALILLLQRSKKILYTAVIVILIAIVFITLNFDELSSRGFSSRPELWSLTLEKIFQRPFLGYGIGSELLLYIESLDMSFSEPHNIHLGLSYSLGAIGLLIWLFFLTQLFIFFIKNKSILLAQIAGLMLMYGLTSGLTEGSNIFTRPKEIWFLIWLPIALLLAAENNYLKTIDKK